MKIDTEILCSFIDGELDERTANAVRSAIDIDPKLGREYQTLQKTAQLVSALPRVSAPADLGANITAHAERAQLFGLSEPGQSRPSRVRWTMSMAASLLIGATLGILGYRSQTWPGAVTPAQPADKPIVSPASDDYEPEAPSPTVFADKAAPAGRSGRRDNRGTVVGEVLDRSGEGVVANSLSRSSKTNYAGKGGPRIARSGPITDAPAKSVAGDFKRAITAQEASEQLIERDGLQEISSAQTPRDEREPTAQNVIDSSRSLDIAGFSTKTPKGSEQAETFASYVGRAEAAKRKNVPLERQVMSNNYFNREMAANLKFEAEPLNVKVVSNDSAKTLKFVQKWARDNSLIDLNGVPATVNFPVYTQAVFQGTPGTNTGVETKNSIFVRTTRKQANDIIRQLQRQKDTVLKVSIKDDKKLLSPPVLGPTQQRIAYSAKLGTLGDGDKKELKKSNLESKAKLAKVQEELHQKRLRKPANGYLFSLTNQAQIFSLEDLVTLVLLVEDAPPAVKTKVTAPAALQLTKPSTSEPQSESK